MTLADRLIAWLDGRPATDGAEIVGWRFELATGQGLRVGIRDSCLGGPYVGPGVADRTAGNLELHWSDGLVTRAGLDRPSILAPDRALDEWRADGFRDRTGSLPPLAGPTDLPEVETFDPAVDAAISDRPEAGLLLMRELLAASRAAGVHRTDAVLRLGSNARTVATSRAFRADWRDTACSIELWGDETASAPYGRRRLPEAAEVDALVAHVAELADQMRAAQTPPGGPVGVLFMPAVVEELLTRLVMPNLAGRAIRDGRSRFSRADLAAGREIVRPDFDLIIDTTLPLELATAPCSAEGVPAGRVGLIASGRLASPVLDLATAAQFGLAPTPVPRGRPAVRLESGLPPLELSEAVALLGNGVVVRELPGLHTQAARRLAYAVVVPDAQVVADGRPGGRCAVRLSGNLLDHLTQPSTRPVHIPGEPNPGLLVRNSVEVLPA